MWSKYVELTKPGIIRGNLLTATAGYFLAVSQFGFALSSFLGMLIGLGAVIGGSCVLNNIIDQDIDASMKRTKKRATVTGAISNARAVLFATILLLVGSLILLAFVNVHALSFALLGVVLYAGVYTYYKRHTHHSTLIGSLSGAIPPVVGYVAASSVINLACLLLFLSWAFWQMPHFYAVAIYRKQDYIKAGIPLLPIVKGFAITRTQMIIYTCLFALSFLPYYVFGYTGIIYPVVMVLVSAWWLSLILKTPNNESVWARRAFKSSLIVILFFVAMTSAGGLLP